MKTVGGDKCRNWSAFFKISVGYSQSLKTFQPEHIVKCQYIQATIPTTIGPSMSTALLT